MLNFDSKLKMNVEHPKEDVKKTISYKVLSPEDIPNDRKDVWDCQPKFGT